MSDPLTMHRGDSKEWEFPIVKADGTPQDLTGVSGRFTAKYRIADLDAAAVFAKTTPTGIVITDATGGKLEVRLVPADTDGLTAPVTLWWGLQLRDSAGKVLTPREGRLFVAPDIPRTAP